MIEKIDFLKLFGVYQNFKWGDLPKFLEKNIIYGGNYSGKTTISRLFKSIKDKKLDQDFLDSSFKITVDKNQEINQENIGENDLKISIFNSDYIRENLRWEQNEHINGITFDVGEAVGIREQIQLIENNVNQIKGNEYSIGRKVKHQQIVQEFEKFEIEKFTNESKIIKNDIFNSLIEFNKGHFKNIIQTIKENLLHNIINDSVELLQIKRISVSSNDKELIELIKFHINLTDIHQQIDELIKKEPKKNDIIDSPENNINASNWAKAGIELHNSQLECFFCGNSLDDTRLDQLKLYFSNASADLRNDIDKKISEINLEIQNLNQIKLPTSKFLFYNNFQEEFQTQIDMLDSIKYNIVEYLQFLKSELERKIEKNIFLKQDFPSFDTTIETSYTEWVQKTNSIITNHNQLYREFADRQETSRDRLKKHQVATFLVREDYIMKEAQASFAKRCIQRYDKYIRNAENEIQRLEAELKSVAKGKEELNIFIKQFLNRNDIKIEVVNDDKFILKRGEKIANNLSEGEKTAISFSYFLVTLESLFREGKLFEYIIYIDDPISSLDGNHIAQIYSLINSFFFRQNIDTANPEQYVNCFKQLFISTHNFEFFTFLKDSNRINRKNSKEYYYIKKINNSESTIQRLPSSLRNFKSEYIYLFDVIYRFYENGCQESDERFILMPNAVRRFLEIYTLMKLPDSTGEIDERIKILMPDQPNELKLLHHFSHFTTFEKITKHDEIILNLPSAISEVITLLQKDEVHFNSLKRAISR